MAVHELLVMAAAGLSPLLSLQSVSVNAARLLGIDDHVGQIRPGYAATSSRWPPIRSTISPRCARSRWWCREHHHGQRTTATGPDGAALHRGDTGAQALVCLNRVERALTALGAGLNDVVRTVVYLAPGASWEQAAQAHREVLGAVRPANTMLYAGALIGDGFLVEIEAQAVVDR